MPSMSSLRIEPALRWLQSFLARDWPLALPLALAFLGLPPLLLAAAMPPLQLPIPRTVAEVEAVYAMLPPFFGPAALLTALLHAIGALALAALAVVPRVSVREALALALKRLPVWIALVVLVWAGLVLAVSLLGTLLLLVGIGNAGLFFLMVATGVIAACFLVLMVPLVADRTGGPIAALGAGWRLYRAPLLKLGGALCLFWLGIWVVAVAAQVGLGSLAELAGRAAGAPALGHAAALIITSFAGAVHGGLFYLFAAALYRLASGVAASKGM